MVDMESQLQVGVVEAGGHGGAGAKDPKTG